MGRRRKPPRLNYSGSKGQWVIHDGEDRIRTGCGLDDRRGAEEALARHISSKFEPAVRERDPDKLPVAEVLTAYGREKAPFLQGQTPATVGYAISALTPWWGKKMLSEINEPNCRAYFTTRGRSAGLVRRELGVLAASITYWHKNHGPLLAVPAVWLPEAPPGRVRWLSRSEAALLLAGALGFYRVSWSDLATRKLNQRWERDRDRIQRHVARFILLGLYTGSRPGVITAVRWLANTVGGWVDVERGVIHRRAEDEVETRKRKPPARLGARILAHLRRWKRLDDAARRAAAAEVGNDVPSFLTVVHYGGDAIEKVRRGFSSAVELAQLEGEVTPHCLRHTRATWLMIEGVDPWGAAGHLGMSYKTLMDIYGHHHPDFQRKAAEV